MGQAKWVTTIRRQAARRVAGALGVAAISLLAACGSSDPGTPTTPEPASTSVTISASASPTPVTSSASTAATSRPSSASSATGSAAPNGVATKLTGTIERGVESGCVVLVDPQGAVQANLIGLDAASAPFGSAVVVTGKFHSDMMTTCMQGEPFVVAKVELQ